MLSNSSSWRSARAVSCGGPRRQTIAAVVVLGIVATATVAGTTTEGHGPSVVADVLGWLERWRGALALAGCAIAIWAGLVRDSLATFLGGIALAGVPTGTGDLVKAVAQRPAAQNW